jgi:hypothetical protein
MFIIGTHSRVLLQLISLIIRIGAGLRSHRDNQTVSFMAFALLYVLGLKSTDFVLASRSQIRSSSRDESSSSSASSSRNSPTLAGSDEYELFFEPGSYDKSKADAIDHSLTLLSDLFPEKVSKLIENPVKCVREYATMVLQFLQLISRRLLRNLEIDHQSENMMHFLDGALSYLQLHEISNSGSCRNSKTHSQRAPSSQFDRSLSSRNLIYDCSVQRSEFQS